MTDAIQIVTTTGSHGDAAKIAAALLDARFAACVQVSGPIESHYHWEGKLETAQEWLCTIKTHRERYSHAEQMIRDLHPYDEPEILATPVVMGSEGYLQWLRASTS